jgi:uncharacterized protein
MTVKILSDKKENGNYSDTIRIRAHHLLCIQGFQGYGYTPEFVSHMKRLISFLKSDLKYKLQIVVGSDELCSHCPHDVDGQCIKGYVDEINKVDRLVVEKANLDLKHIYTVFEAFNTVNKKLNYDQILEICLKCSWKEKCLFYIKKTNI